MTPLLEYTLAALCVVVIVVLIILTVYTVKFLKETTVTMTGLRELTDVIKQEIKPALQSVNRVLSTVNNVSDATNKQLEIVKKVLTTLLGASCVAFTNARTKCGFLSGLVSGFNLFRKKRR